MGRVDVITETEMRGRAADRDRYIKEEHTHTLTTPPLFILLVDWQEMRPPNSKEGVEKDMPLFTPPLSYS